MLKGQKNTRTKYHKARLNTNRHVESTTKQQRVRLNRDHRLRTVSRKTSWGREGRGSSTFTASHLHRGPKATLNTEINKKNGSHKGSQLSYCISAKKPIIKQRLLFSFLLSFQRTPCCTKHIYGSDTVCVVIR